MTWEKNRTLREIKSEIYGQKLKIFKNKVNDISFFEVKFKGSKNFIPLPGYDTIKIKTPSEIYHHLELLSVELSPFTTALVPFQMSSHKKEELLATENLHNIIFRNNSYFINCKLSKRELLNNMRTRKRDYVLSFKEEDIYFSVCKEELKEKIFDYYSFTANFLKLSDNHVLNNDQLNRLLDRDDTLLFGLGEKNHIEIIHMIGADLNSGHAYFYISAFNSAIARSYSLRLFWESFNFLKLMGISNYHLGGGISPGDGLERFKKEMGGDEYINFCMPLIQDKKLYNELYHQTSTTQKELGVFPAYLSRVA